MLQPNNTQPTNVDVEAILSAIQPARKQEDCRKLNQIMQEVSGHPPVLWGNIMGYGRYHYTYETGREGDMLLIGFAPRAKNISIYAAAYNDELDQQKKGLGKVKLGKSCIYINKLEDIDVEKLKHILKESMRITLERYPQS